ncbi:MAG: acetoacetate decarboxylase family protein [Burkholderiales bacterium]|nr:acetoacetate decarboxylase family protein [Burkholderiales bacterium]
MPHPTWQHDVFFQYPLSRFGTSCGEIDLPILYYDCSVVMAIFLVDADKAAAAVRDVALTVVPIAGGKALVGVAFYEYRETAIGPYNEVGVAIVVAPKGQRLPRLPWWSLVGALDKNPLGFHIVDLPVTTDAACSAGREAWGYPKFVTPIAFASEGQRFRGVVTDPQDQSDLLTLEGRIGMGLPGPLLDLALYSRLNGQVLRTLVNTRGGAQLAMGGGLQLKVSASSRHPMAERLRMLGLDGARPLCVSHSDRLQLRLNAGAPIADNPLTGSND